MTTSDKTVTNLAIVSAVAAGVIAAGSANAAEMDLKLRKDWTPHGMHVAFYLGKEKGWFKKAGVNLTIEDGKGSASTVGLVGAGQADIGHAGLNTMAIARTKGLPVVAIGSILRRNEVGILFDKGKGYAKPADFKGKQLIYTAGSTEAPFIDTFLGAGKMKRSDVKLLAVDASAKVSTYLSGKGDGVIGPVPFFQAIMRGKRNSDWVLFADFGMPMLSWGIVANEDAVKNKPKALAAFMQVLGQSWSYIRQGDAQLTEACTLMIKARAAAKVSMGACKGIFKAYQPYTTSASTKGKPVGYITDADWADTVATMKKLGLIPGSAKTKDFYTLAFNPKS